MVPQALHPSSQKGTQLLTIRHEQMKVLEEYAERRFFEDLLQASSLDHATVVDLRSRVWDAVRRADAYGIADREDLLWFIDLDLRRGAAWEMEPGMEWAHDVLDAPQTDVAGRRYRLEKRFKQKRLI